MHDGTPIPTGRLFLGGLVLCGVASLDAGAGPSWLPGSYPMRDGSARLFWGGRRTQKRGRGGPSRPAERGGRCADMPSRWKAGTHPMRDGVARRCDRARFPFLSRASWLLWRLSHLRARAEAVALPGHLLPSALQPARLPRPQGTGVAHTNRPPSVGCRAAAHRHGIAWRKGRSCWKGPAPASRQHRNEPVAASSGAPFQRKGRRCERRPGVAVK